MITQSININNDSDWILLFRSSDPSIWDTDFNEKESFAIKLNNAPDNIKYLKLKNTEGQSVIIPMRKSCLTSNIMVTENFGWAGNNNFSYLGFHLGIYNSKMWSGKSGDVHIVSDAGGYTGWGFGNGVLLNNGQYYSWNHKQINKCIFEISVKCNSLTNEEKKLMLEEDSFKNKINLKNTTYILVDGREDNDFTDPILYARYANKYIDFAKFVILTPDSDKYKNHELIEFQYIHPFNYTGYSQFMVEQLHKYIDTEFCLIYQNDSGVVNPYLWDNEFFNYDYIGAPWPQNSPVRNCCKNPCGVGNGGFCLRSKKFLQVSSKLDNSKKINEDVFLVCLNKDFMIKNSIKIPGCDIAKKFSVEYPIDNNHKAQNCFGFHSPRASRRRHIEWYRQKINSHLLFDSEKNETTITPT